jgi:hypothetical protein
METHMCSSSRNIHERRFGALKRAAFLVVSAVLLSGCTASSVQRGAEFYMQRRYIDAAQVFEHTERQLPEWEEAERAEYSLYRGATFLALGDRDGARQWLSEAQRGWTHLSADDRALLTDSLRAVDEDRGVSPVRLESATGLVATPGRLSP